MSALISAAADLLALPPSILFTQHAPLYFYFLPAANPSFPPRVEVEVEVEVGVGFPVMSAAVAQLGSPRRVSFSLV